MPSSISPPTTVVVVDPYPPCSIFLLAFICFRNKHIKKRTTPFSDSESKSPPHRFSYSLLRHATASFSTLIGHGGFGPVFSGSLPSTLNPKSIAVKLMDSASLQGEREFHNELFFASRLHSQHVVVATGFASDKSPRRRRFLLVYELMPNGNLQDALLRRKCPELMNWKKRFAIVLDIAKGIRYLHHSCDPPVIHGDIKPSNILLDANFSAKIADYGLARLKSQSQYDVEETESISMSINTEAETSPETEEANFETPIKISKISKSRSVKDWWAKQDDDETHKKNKKKKKIRKELEWWREEYCEKLSKKNKNKSTRNEIRSSRSCNSIDRWFESSGNSRSCHEIRSTPSMRGTVCYVAPEYKYDYEITEKCDVYGFGVLLLVIVSGRRPLEMDSPLMSEIQRGNLLSWARHCARNGKLIEIVDRSVKWLNEEEALLCIKVALLCLLKSPSRRPSMEEVVGMLCGEVAPPRLPVEYSPSPPLPERFPFKYERN